MAIGSTAPWIDHEKNVCSRDSATISSLVMEPEAVVMPMGHLGTGAAITARGSDVEDGSTPAIVAASLQHNWRTPAKTPSMPAAHGLHAPVSAAPTWICDPR